MDLGFNLKLENPKRNVGIFSKLFFGWVIPLIKKGVNEGLHLEDLYKPLKKDKSQDLTDKLEVYWEDEVQKAQAKNKKPSLVTALFKQFHGEIILYGVVWFCSNVIMCLRPIILAKLIKLFADKDVNKNYEMYIYSVALILTSFLSIMGIHHMNFSMQAVGMRIRIATSSLVYRKITCLDQSSLGQTPAGKVVNILSNDLSRFDLALPVIHALWVMPFQVVVIFLIIWQQVGIAAVSGVVMMVLVTVPVQGFLAKYVGELRVRVSKKTDSRVKLMSEIVSGIQVIKMYAWEKPFEKLVQLTRGNEMRDISIASYMRGIYTSTMVFSDKLSLFATLITYVLLGNIISADKVFSVAQSFGILQLAMAVAFPLAISMGAEALISIQRVEDFLALEEKEDEDIIRGPRKTGITISYVDASWTETGCTLEDINIRIPPGTLCAVVGPVGAGKSSLLQLLTGELPTLSGGIEIGGEISYSSQQPWLFQSTVRNNILFGNHYDKNLYKKVVKVCALESDFEQFPHGDRTFVGEKGVSLSGGQRARINLARAVYRKADIYLLDDPLSAVDTHVGKHLFNECICKHLKGKTRILVTHQLQYLKKADMIIVLNDGIIEAQGTLEELSSCNLDFTKILVAADETEENDEEDIGTDPGISETTRKCSLTSEGSRKFSISSSTKMSLMSASSSDISEKGNRIIDEKSGDEPNSKPFRSYLASTKNNVLVAFVIFLLLASQGLIVGVDQWLTLWTSEEQIRHSNDTIIIQTNASLFQNGNDRLFSGDNRDNHTHVFNNSNPDLSNKHEKRINEKNNFFHNSNERDINNNSINKEINFVDKHENTTNSMVYDYFFNSNNNEHNLFNNNKESVNNTNSYSNGINEKHSSFNNNTGNVNNNDNLFNNLDNSTNEKHNFSNNHNEDVNNDDSSYQANRINKENSFFNNIIGSVKNNDNSFNKLENSTYKEHSFFNNNNERVNNNDTFFNNLDNSTNKKQNFFNHNKAINNESFFNNIDHSIIKRHSLFNNNNQSDISLNSSNKNHRLNNNNESDNDNNFSNNLDNIVKKKYSSFNNNNQSANSDESFFNEHDNDINKDHRFLNNNYESDNDKSSDNPDSIINQKHSLFNNNNQSDNGNDISSNEHDNSINKEHSFLSNDKKSGNDNINFSNNLDNNMNKSLASLNNSQSTNGNASFFNEQNNSTNKDHRLNNNNESDNVNNNFSSHIDNIINKKYSSFNNNNQSANSDDRFFNEHDNSSNKVHRLNNKNESDNDNNNFSNNLDNIIKKKYSSLNTNNQSANSDESFFNEHDNVINKDHRFLNKNYESDNDISSDNPDSIINQKHSLINNNNQSDNGNDISSNEHDNRINKEHSFLSNDKKSGNDINFSNNLDNSMNKNLSSLNNSQSGNGNASFLKEQDNNTNKDYRFNNNNESDNDNNNFSSNLDDIINKKYSSFNNNKQSVNSTGNFFNNIDNSTNNERSFLKSNNKSINNDDSSPNKLDNSTNEEHSTFSSKNEKYNGNYEFLNKFINSINKEHPTSSNNNKSGNGNGSFFNHYDNRDNKEHRILNNKNGSADENYDFFNKSINSIKEEQRLFNNGSANRNGGFLNKFDNRINKEYSFSHNNYSIKNNSFLNKPDNGFTREHNFFDNNTINKNFSNKYQDKPNITYNNSISSFNKNSTALNDIMRKLHIRDIISFVTMNFNNMFDYVIVDGSVQRLFKTESAMYIYGTMILSVVLLVLSRTYLFFTSTIMASENLHSTMFNKLIKAPMRFFDTNPSGRILNRFSRDIGCIDEILPRVILESVSIFLIMVGILLNIVIASPIMIIALVLLGALFLKFRSWYMVTAKTVKHLEGITKSPVFSHVNSTLCGIITIRASKSEDILIEEFDRHQDVHTSAWYLTLACMNAFGLWLDLIVIVFLAIVTFSFVILTSFINVNGSQVGLAISQCMVLTGMLQYGMKQSSEVINNLTSVERILQYTTIENEGPFETPKEKRPKGTWPRRGNIEFKNLYLKYVQNEPAVLKGLNIMFQPGEKIGIVGRTGAGKSSLISALFRLAPLEGSVLIDRVDTNNLGLTDLRKKISIIPQEPVLFSETLRYNLDPFGEFDDDKIWDTLELVELKDSIDSLDFLVAEGGANFSLGQRQLICLARAILKENKILVLDEATANVDRRTDSLIQGTIRRVFKECTVLTIAHRLNTIMDSDKVLVMSFGSIVEFDHPHNLLKIEDGYFYNMVMETSPAMVQEFKNIAQKAYDKYMAEKSF